VPAAPLTPRAILAAAIVEIEYLRRLRRTGAEIAELVMDALDMALRSRRPRRPVIHHSDQGCQYTSIAFGQRCREAGVQPSMGSVGDAYDNALCESFFATLECELLDRQRFASHAVARLAVFEYLEGWSRYAGDLPLL
jgi:transposase InsO family protein